MEPRENPFAAPLSDLAPPDRDETDVEAIRRKHLRHETSIQTIGALYFLGALIGAIAAGGILYTSLRDGRFETFSIVVLWLLATAVAVNIAVGYGLRVLSPHVKIPVVLLSILGLMGFPLGTLINAYVLYLVLSQKGQYILSPKYAEIRRQTPHMHFKTSLASWIALGFLLTLLAVIVVVFIIGI